jgi:hypothetical protein
MMEIYLDHLIVVIVVVIQVAKVVVIVVQDVNISMYQKERSIIL